MTEYSSAKASRDTRAFSSTRMSSLSITTHSNVSTLWVCKNAVKKILKDLIAYQQANGFPFRFFTETSLDLAEEDELITLMTEANIHAVFIGIESPNEKSLQETRKTQNVRPKAGSLLDRVHKIQRAGVEVWCGMIVGFDNDDETIFDAQLDFLAKARIPHIMIGMLYAIPKTPLHARLSREGRLDHTDSPAFGTNIIPMQLSREGLQEGYQRVMRSLHEPTAYFERLEDLYLRGMLRRENLGRVKHWKTHAALRLRQQTLNVIGAFLFFVRLMKHVDRMTLRQEYRRRIWRVIKATRDPSVVFTYVGKCAMHFHYDKLIREMERGAAINTL
jgi:radical SAM superfamily enzyme YgiQ (UPF0313 family)